MMSNTAITGTLYKFENQLVTLVIVVVIITVLSLVYYVKQLRQDGAKGEKKGYVMWVDYFIKSIESTIESTMGHKAIWFTPYAIFLLLYIGIGNMMGLLGLEPPLTSYTVTFMLGLVTFVGIYITGISTHKWKFFLKYVKNPTEIIGQFAPLISITFRIFGNLTAGTVIIFLFFLLTNSLTRSIPVLGYINILGGLFGWILKFYFDVFDGLVQTYIFMLLTLSYIGIETAGERRHQQSKLAVRRSSTVEQTKAEDEVIIHDDAKYREPINEQVDIVRKQTTSNAN